MTGPFLSPAIERMKPSATMAMTQRAGEMKRAGIDVIGLSAGEPDFPTPPHVIEAAREAMREGKTRYTDIDGTAELKQAIVDKFARENGLDYSSRQISVGAGGKQVLFNAMIATLRPGDEVVIPAPYWVSYPDIARFADASPVIVKTDAQTGYKMSADQLADAIGPKTRWVVLNSPSNPTGAAYSADELSALGAVLREHPDILILSDDIYEHIWFADGPFATIAATCPDLQERTLTLNGVSKGYAMTGWRIGYAAGPEVLIRAMSKIQSQSTTNPCTISQWAAVEALNGPQDYIRDSRAAFQRRRDLVVGMLNACPGIDCPMPEGAFYVYPSIRDLIGKTSATGVLISDDEAFATALLDETGVAVVFGAAFGLSPAFRISYATSDARLTDACTRIQTFCNGLR